MDKKWFFVGFIVGFAVLFTIDMIILFVFPVESTAEELCYAWSWSAADYEDCVEGFRSASNVVSIANLQTEFIGNDSCFFHVIPEGGGFEICE